MKFLGTIAILIAMLTLGFASPSTAVSRDKTSVTLQDKLFGVVDDNPVMAAAAQSGFDFVKRTIWLAPTNNTWDKTGVDPVTGRRWEPIPPRYRTVIDAGMVQAHRAGIKVIIELYPVLQFGPPRGPNQMRGMCDVAKDFLDEYPETFGVEVGVEPNSSTFWKPQFNPDGTQASAAPYLKWLGSCYDKVKASHPDVIVIGGSLSSRGEDQPAKEGSDTSPVLWLQKFCAAYRASGRLTPVMNWFDMHSYPDPEDQDPSVSHPYPSTTITMADYAKLDDLLSCFNGTGQPKPLIFWGETGYNTDVPEAMIGKNYSKQAKPSSVKLVDIPTQGRYAAKQIRMVACQPNAVAWANFHFVDDADRYRDWQSGFAFAPAKVKRSSSSASVSYNLKQSLPEVRQAREAVKSGTVKCGSPGSP